MGSLCSESFAANDPCRIFFVLVRPGLPPRGSRLPVPEGFAAKHRLYLAAGHDPVGWHGRLGGHENIWLSPTSMSGTTKPTRSPARSWSISLSGCKNSKPPHRGCVRRGSRHLPKRRIGRACNCVARATVAEKIARASEPVPKGLLALRLRHSLLPVAEAVPPAVRRL
jgi:hypothetical protein